jgi:hypothetical protein
MRSPTASAALAFKDRNAHGRRGHRQGFFNSHRLLRVFKPDACRPIDWNLEDFISTMRTGIDPAGHELGHQMPWQPIGKLDDEELAALYQYLIHLPD